MLDLKHLRVLKEVAEQGSFSAAAAALDYTQPAISQQIAALERQVDARLVDRSTRGVRLTEAGRALLGHAEEIFARIAEAEAELEAISGGRGGSVRLESFPTGGASLIPLATAVFRDRHPGVELELSVAGQDAAEDRLRAGEIDVAVLLESGLERRPKDARIERTHLLDDPMLVALPVDHRRADETEVRLAELADERWIVDNSSCPDSTIFLHACHRAGFEPEIALQNEDYMAIQGFIAAGVGIALIPWLALQGVRDDIAIVPLAGRVPVRRVVVATLAAGHRSPATEAMVEVLREVSAEHAPGRAPMGRPRLGALA